MADLEARAAAFDAHLSRGAMLLDNHGAATADADFATATVATIATNEGAGDADVEVVAVAGWPVLVPLVAKIEPEPYPLDALPATIRAAIEEVQGFAKAPMPMVASCALSAISLALQAHVDVKRAERLTGPSSLFMLTIADSGERKSTCDGFFTKSIRDYEQRQALAAKPELDEYHAAQAAWEAKRSGVLDDIRAKTKAGHDTGLRESVLHDLEAERPLPPRVPSLIYGDVTPEQLAFSLAHNWPSGGVISAEAGIVFGAHGMGKDSIMRNLGLLNVLWDGGDHKVGRRTSESYTVRGARLTVGVLIQEETLRSFFDRAGGLPRGSGFFARFLMAWPESTMGTRMYSDPPAHWVALDEFNRRLTALLDKKVAVDPTGTLQPSMITMTPEAEALWIEFHDAIEAELRTGGELQDVRDLASKCADNAARLAVLFQTFEAGGGAIERDAVEGACRVAAWHLNESRRFFGELALPPNLANAARLDAWLHAWARERGTRFVSRRDLQRNGPTSLRESGPLDAALNELVDCGRIRWIGKSPAKRVELRPNLWDDVP